MLCMTTDNTSTSSKPRMRREKIEGEKMKEKRGGGM